MSCKECRDRKPKPLAHSGTEACSYLPGFPAIAADIAASMREAKDRVKTACWPVGDLLRPPLPSRLFA